MKVITLHQPWASLVVLGHKSIETRSWNTKYRGELLIHASAAKNKEGLALYHRECWDKITAFANKHFVELPFGAIIGKVNLIGTSETEFYTQCSQSNIPLKEGRPFSKKEWERELAFGDYSPGRFGWLLTSAVPFDKSIPAKGSLGIWEYKEPLIFS